LGNLFLLTSTIIWLTWTRLINWNYFWKNFLKLLPINWFFLGNSFLGFGFLKGWALVRRVYLFLPFGNFQKAFLLNFLGWDQEG